LALVCNIVVVAGSCINYYRNGLVKWNSIWPIVLLSVPFAFVGGLINLEIGIYKLVVSLLLIFAALLMIIDRGDVAQKKYNFTKIKSAFLGGGIGFLSGLIGIGGGVFLAPVLHLSKYDKPLAISVIASFFILFNSLSGLMGQFATMTALNYKLLFILGLAVLIGGQIGNRLNISILKPTSIRKLTALLVGFVGVRILWTYFNF